MRADRISSCCMIWPGLPSCKQAGQQPGSRQCGAAAQHGAPGRPWGSSGSRSLRCSSRARVCVTSANAAAAAAAGGSGACW
jgi:hypothetical protein